MTFYKTVIVLVNYNSLDDTIECLNSILNIKYNVVPYVVLIDNASTNQSSLDGSLSHFKNLKLIKSEKNIGFGRANNLAIEWIQSNLNCSYIFLLNNDTILDYDTMTRLEQSLFSSDIDTVMVAPKILIYSSPKEIWYGGGTIDFKKITPIIEVNSSIQLTKFASGCSMFFKAEFLYSINGFDPFFFMYDEDVELCIRLSKMGKKILYSPTALVFHKCQGSQTKNVQVPSNQLHPLHPSLLFYLSNTIINRRYIIRKHLHGYNKIRSSFFHHLYWLLKSVQYLLYFKIKPFFLVLKCLCVPIPTSIKF